MLVDQHRRSRDPTSIIPKVLVISTPTVQKAPPGRPLIANRNALTVPVISREDLLAAKLSAGRPQDLADVDALNDVQENPESADR